MKSRATQEQDARNRFAGALQSALTLGEVENAFFDVVQDVIPAGGFGLYRLDTESGNVVSVRAEVGSDFLDDYEEYGRDDDPVLDFVLEQRRPIDSSRAVPADRWTSCGARSALGVGGYAHSLEAPVVVSGTFFGTINFARTEEQPSFDDDDLIAARFASEQLSLATERALRFESTGHRASMLEHVLDRMPQAVVVTDLSAQVLYRNRIARDEPWLTVSPDALGRLGPVDESIAEAMEEFRRDGKRVHTRSLRDQRSGRQVIVKSYRLADNDDAAVTLIFNCGQEKVERLPLWDVLSRREQEIAELVSQGLTTKQIAERAFVTENTVKQHLKRVFAKTDVRNRAELIQLIWSSGNRGADGSRAGTAAG
ncbi:LuxR C-terminal-related transcriptional regulator [Phytoactinopolyspora limicola]|uniref:LuxR C-terminal-related transcriptional regulator n=1 Tax=Phytoactinopolyspora limicola TaxID=2715536 RepID=UPI00140AA719|nr:LuxR C-terminal-related transcriptional regulator [Phytoactinopolyspora limicola]